MYGAQNIFVFVSFGLPPVTLNLEHLALHYFSLRWTCLHIIEPQHEISNSGILTRVDSEEPMQTPFKLRNSK